MILDHVLHPRAIAISIYGAVCDFLPLCQQRDTAPRGCYTISPRARLAFLQQLPLFWRDGSGRLIDDDFTLLAFRVAVALDRALASAELFVFWRSARICDKFMQMCELEQYPDVYHLLKCVRARHLGRSPPRKNITHRQ